MIPIEKLTLIEAQDIEYVLTDIDDTLTVDGMVLPETYNALWDLYSKGVSVIPVTGRPAGWCDLIIRQWPVQAVIGENGAFVFYRNEEEFYSLVHPSIPEPAESVRQRLDEIKTAVLREVPGSRVAKDQFARLYDLAVDFNEDPPRLGYEAAAKIKRICECMGAVAKISSIHVNAWFGDYDKLAMTKLFFGRVHKMDENEIRKKVVFCGDSPNDEPMFSFFSKSVAVANIKDFIGTGNEDNKEGGRSDAAKNPVITHLPVYVTRSRGGIGFAEFSAELIRKKFG